MKALLLRVIRNSRLVYALRITIGGMYKYCFIMTDYENTQILLTHQ